MPAWKRITNVLYEPEAEMAAKVVEQFNEMSRSNANGDETMDDDGGEVNFCLGSF